MRIDCPCSLPASVVLVGSTTVVTILIGSLCCQFWLAVLVGRPARHAGWQSLPRDFENAKMKDISDRMAPIMGYMAKRMVRGDSASREG